MACLDLGLSPATLAQRPNITLFLCLLERRFSPCLSKHNKHPSKDKGEREYVAGKCLKLLGQPSGELYRGNRGT